MRKSSKSGKTQTVRKIDIRSPDGTLLSRTIQRTTTFGPQPILPPIGESVGSSNTVHSEMMDGDRSRQRIPIDQRSERTELVDLNAPIGESTIYGDNWSECSTVNLNRARLISQRLPHYDLHNELTSIIHEINIQRRVNGVRELNVEDDLMREAKRLATQMAVDRRIKVFDDTNIWLGPQPISPKEITDEWSTEMSLAPRNHFKARDLTRIGVGKALFDFDKKLWIVVAVYD